MRSPSVEVSPQLDFLRTSLLSFDEKVADDAASRAVLPENTHFTQVTPWLKRTRWVNHLAGCNARDSRQLCALPAPEEDHLTRLCTSIDLMLGYFHRGAQPENCPTSVLRILASHTPDNYEVIPASFEVNPRTFAKYTCHWKHFLCYLLRAYSHPDDSKLVLSPVQQSLIAKLDLDLRNSHTDDQHILDQIAAISTNVLEQSLESWVFESPLVHFLSVYAINPHDLVWATPSTFTPTLSGLLYVARLILLEASIPQASRSSSFVRKFQEYHHTHLVDGSLSAISELISLRSYGLTIASDHYSMPSCYWAKDMSKLYFCDQTIVISDLRSMISHLMLEAKTLLCNDLVFRPLSYLVSRDPSNFVDNLTWATNDQCFVDIDRNHLSGGASRVLQWLQSSDQFPDFIRSTSSSSNGHGFRSKAVNVYAAKVSSFLDLLMALCHLLGGMPARGTELTSLKLRNSWASMRSFYIVDGVVMFLSQWEKNQSRTNAPKLIPRFLPSCLGQMLVAYLADVQPFLSYLQYTKKFPSTASRQFLWSANDVPYTTDHLSRILGQHTTKYLNARLTASSWRHVAISIERDVVQSLDPHELDDGEEEPSDLQAGHGGAVAQHHYGIRSDLLVSLSDKTIRRFRVVSERWHAYLSMEHTTSFRATSQSVASNVNINTVSPLSHPLLNFINSFASSDNISPSGI